MVNTSFSGINDGSITILDAQDLKVLEKMKAGKMPVEAILDEEESFIHYRCRINTVNVVEIDKARWSNK